MDASKSHFYYFRKRLFRNKPALFGLIVILVSIIVTLLGYQLMPDNSPNANEGAVQIQKKTPGFEATLITINKNVEVKKVGFWEKLLFGQEKDYTQIPIDLKLISRTCFDRSTVRHSHASVFYGIKKVKQV